PKIRLQVQSVRSSEQIGKPFVKQQRHGFLELMHGGEAETGPVPLARDPGEQEEAFNHIFLRKAFVLQQGKDFLVELLQSAAHPNQRRPQIPPSLVAGVISHLPIAAAPEPAGPDLAQMAHDVRKQVATTPPDKLKKAVGEVHPPTVWMSFLQFADQFSGVANSITKRQAFL